MPKAETAPIIEVGAIYKTSEKVVVITEIYVRAGGPSTIPLPMIRYVKVDLNTKQVGEHSTDFSDFYHDEFQYA